MTIEYPLVVNDDHGTLSFMATEVAACNREKGWYDHDRTFGEDIALLHSEVSEMLEAYRIGGTADQTMENAPDGGLPKPEGVGSEAADVLVRLLDTCYRHDVDLFAEWRRKVTYNWTRQARHGGKRL
jgi:NTP pyrophosphatase (non-canonical NTP hydrolase)